jgi:hypothetical protein
MITDFLTVSGVAFWVWLLFAFALVAGWLGKDNQFVALTIAGIALIVTLLFTDAFRGASIFWLAVLTPLYMLIGVAWAIYKWRGVILSQLAQAKAAYAKYLSEAKPVGAALNKSFADWTAHGAYRRPTAYDNAERITGWIALWPWSMSWVVLRFPWRLVVWTWEHLSTFFERMSAKLWAE